MILAVVMRPFAKVVAVLASCGMDGHEEGQGISPSKAAGYEYVVVSSYYQSHRCSSSLSYTQSVFLTRSGFSRGSKVQFVKEKPYS